MTDTTREAVEMVARLNESRCRTRPHAPLMSIREPEPLGVETAKMLRALLTRAEAAEANGEKWRSMWEKEQSHNEELRAERDALRAKLALAVEALAFYGNESHYVGEHIADPCGCCGSWYEPLIHKDGQDSGNKARAALAQLTADTLPDPRIEGWNAAIEAAAEVAEAEMKKNAAETYSGGTVTVHKSGQSAAKCYAAGTILEAIRAIPCPYQPKEGKDDER